MTPKFRTLALAAMSWGAALSAQAATLHFDDLAGQALSAGAPLSLTNQISGFSFTGATVYHVNQAAAPAPSPNPSNNGDGFVQNRASATAPNDQTISLLLVGALANDDIETFSFDFAKGANTTLNIFAFGKNASGNAFVQSFGGISGGSAWSWTNQSLPNLLAGLGVVNRIDFVVQNVGDFTPGFALDNLQYTLAGTGNTVPEPAGLGLVALALAAAGLSIRKRRA